MRRLLSALLGLWFVLVGQEPPFAHPCTMPPAAMAAPAAATGAAHDAHAGHGAAHAGAGHEAHGDASDDAPAPATDDCRCVGDCCCPVATPSAPPAAVVLGHVPPAVRAAALEIPATLGVASASLRRQPFAIGPPRPDIA